MELNNEFRVAVPAATTWAVLTDVERVAKCLPGATLLTVDGDDFTGAVKVKVGPITVSYKGEASSRRRTRPPSASCSRPMARKPAATAVPPPSSPRNSRTRAPQALVSITTDLTISGKAAQFGRGVLADVSSNLITQFARSLEADLLEASAPSGDAVEQPAAQAAAGDSVDLLKVAALPVAKRAAPALTAAAAAATVGYLLGEPGEGQRFRTPCGPRTFRPPCCDCCREVGVMKAANFAYHRPKRSPTR